MIQENLSVADYGDKHLNTHGLGAAGHRNMSRIRRTTAPTLGVLLPDALAGAVAHVTDEHFVLMNFVDNEVIPHGD
jgi:hypothetical protein